MDEETEVHSSSFAVTSWLASGETRIRAQASFSSLSGQSFLSLSNDFSTWLSDVVSMESLVKLLK